VRVHGARFDWYEMTFDTVDDDRVAPSLALALGGSLARSKGRNGYATGHQITHADGTVLAMVHGHSARLGEVHVTTSSDACDRVVPALRGLYPSHRVSRVDSAVDWVADFDELDVAVVDFALDRGLSHRIVRDSDGGATRYLGSVRSEVMVRLYKKTEQLRAMHPESNQQVQDGIVRLELQARPGKRAVKELVSTMGPEDVWGLSAWSGDLGMRTVGIESERVSTHFRRPSEWSRLLHYLGAQYSPAVTKRAGEAGADQVRREVLAALGLDGA
jgi:hypothetical protein